MAHGDDADLVASYLRGDPPAVAQVNRWISAAALPFRRRLAAEWDDLLQELRLEVFRVLSGRSFRGESLLKTYLAQVTCHTCLDAIRRQRRRTFVDLDEIAGLAAAEPSPLEALTRRQGAEAALRALSTLSAECRELWSRILRGLSYREIEKESGVSEGALRVRAHRCRKAAVDAYREAMGVKPLESNRALR